MSGDKSKKLENKDLYLSLCLYTYTDADIHLCSIFLYLSICIYLYDHIDICTYPPQDASASYSETAALSCLGDQRSPQKHSSWSVRFSVMNGTGAGKPPPKWVASCRPSVLWAEPFQEASLR